MGIAIGVSVGVVAVGCFVMLWAVAASSRLDDDDIQEACVRKE